MVQEKEHFSFSNWDSAFKELAKNGDDQLLDIETVSTTGWDEDEWEWK